MKRIHYIDRDTGETRREIVPGERWLRWLYHDPLGRLALHAVVKRKFLSQWYGWMMDRPASRSKIAEFVHSLQIDTDEIQRPIRSFETFNDFFIRRLKPESRPVDMNPDVIVSPADGRAMGFHGLEALDTFYAKGQRFSLEDLLQNRSLSARYTGGSMLIVRLAPVDYHRFHFPADGRISERTRIDGTYFSVSPHAVKQRMRIYWENTRDYSILRTPRAGDVVLCEVGATMVGSIVQFYTPGTTVHKGEEKGCFKFGGSTIIVLFQKGKIRIDADLLDNTRNGYETRVRMGERMATVLA